VTLPAIEARSLSKVYRIRRPSSVRNILRRSQHERIHALGPLSLTVDQGVIVGVIGNNGAGKSTLLKCLAGILQPSGGACFALGLDCSKRSVQSRRNLGYVMGQRTRLYPDLPVEDSMHVFAKIYGLNHSAATSNIAELAASLALQELLPRAARELSFGQRMRCELAVSLVHTPRILLLDEPTIGLDRDTQAAIRAFLLDYVDRHAASALLVSHYLEDIEVLAERLLVLSNGQKRYDGKLTDLKEIDSQTSVVKVAGELDTETRAYLKNIGRFRQLGDGLVEVAIPTTQASSVLHRVSNGHAAAKLKLEVRPPSIDDLLALLDEQDASG